MRNVYNRTHPSDNWSPQSIITSGNLYRKSLIFYLSKLWGSGDNVPKLKVIDDNNFKWATFFYTSCVYIYSFHSKRYIGPPKRDRKQSIKIKNKNNRSLSFHFDFLGLSVCPMTNVQCSFVALSVLSGFLDIPLYLTNYSIKLIICKHNIRTSSMRGLKWCALFVVSAYISRVINENVRKMAKMEI